MTADIPQESSQAGEPGDLPSPTFSDTGDSSTSDGADAIVSKLTPVIQQIVERTVQSTKDKRISKIEKALGGRIDLLAELEEQGVSIPKDVRTEMQIRELQEQINRQSTPQPASPPDNGLSGQKQAVTDAIADLNKYGLDPNDAEFIGLLRGKYANREAFDLAVSKHVVKKLAPQPTASAAGITQAAATRGATQRVDVDRLQSELVQLSRSPSAPGAMQRMTEIQKLLTEAGV